MLQVVGLNWLMIESYLCTITSWKILGFILNHCLFQTHWIMVLCAILKNSLQKHFKKLLFFCQIFAWNNKLCIHLNGQEIYTLGYGNQFCVYGLYKHVQEWNMHKYDEFGLMPYQIPMNVWFDNTTKKLISILILCLWLACDYCPNQLILWLQQ